jgi:hypothetical protein
MLFLTNFALATRLAILLAIHQYKLALYHKQKVGLTQQSKQGQKLTKPDENPNSV